MKLINKLIVFNREQFFLIAIGILLLLTGIIRIAVTESIISKNIPVKAVVTDSDMESDYIINGEEHDGINDYDITYDYNGKTYTNRIRKDDMPAFDIKNRGETIWIYIDSEEPMNIAVRNHTFSYLCIFVSVISFGTAYITAHRKEKPYKNYE